LATSSVDLWSTIVDEAATESPLWREALRRHPEHEPVFSPLADDRWALGLETIYEGYLLHYGTARLFEPGDRHTALLLGDYLYAHGLVRIAEHRAVGAVAELAGLISVCAQLRADRSPGDGEAWAASAGRLRSGPPVDAVEVERALAAHAARVG
jgi:hypothetical protein